MMNYTLMTHFNKQKQQPKILKIITYGVPMVYADCPLKQIYNVHDW